MMMPRESRGFLEVFKVALLTQTACPHAFFRSRTVFGDFVTAAVQHVFLEHPLQGRPWLAAAGTAEGTTEGIELYCCPSPLFTTDQFRVSRPPKVMMPRIPRGFQSASRSPSPRFALCLSACPSSPLPPCFSRVVAHTLVILSLSLSLSLQLRTSPLHLHVYMTVAGYSEPNSFLHLHIFNHICVYKSPPTLFILPPCTFSFPTFLPNAFVLWCRSYSGMLATS